MKLFLIAASSLLFRGLICLGLFSCDAKASAEGGSRKAEERRWRYENTPLGALDIQIHVPPRSYAGQRFPVLIALHGMGEARKGARRGSLAWFKDYQLAKAIKGLRTPPLGVEDFGGMVDRDRLMVLNKQLAENPYRGLIVVCPYTPLRFAGGRAYASAHAFSSFLMETLLPRIQKETPASSAPESVGIDGVSLGGRAALLTGFASPKSFGAIASLQAAFDAREIPRLVRLAKKAQEVSPRTKLRFLTSRRDVFLKFHQLFSKSLKEARVSHQLRVVAGTHSYAFNRGPGAIEMLVFHDRVLRQ